VLSTLDVLAARFLTPPLQGVSLLDAACGTTRRLRFATGEQPSRIVGIDLVFEMLATGRRTFVRPASAAAADVRALPFPSGSFGVAWCRLAAGHVSDLVPFYRDLSRVLEEGGALVVTDFHPAAVSAGHTRTFHDGAGATRTVAHTVHEPADHEAAAAGEDDFFVTGFECLGACDIAPMASIDERYFGPLETAEARTAIDQLLAGEDVLPAKALEKRPLAGDAGA